MRVRIRKRYCDGGTARVRGSAQHHKSFGRSLRHTKQALTGADIAFLRGLYKMSPDMMLVVQKDQVSYRMEQQLKGH